MPSLRKDRKFEEKLPCPSTPSKNHVSTLIELLLVKSINLSVLSLAAKWINSKWST
ncbi:hypothetical protein RvY_06313 [Ramazzottius varieornatus]|uniref:Uncharacterized protein n=1 Tax=Ramazzottius varieornatus TaxID=947166 RepID=A0A1D1UY31_RAMVA|nr:hypothetical protein RvY_06313 [Ramazzottius varieornatus]